MYCCLPIAGACSSLISQRTFEQVNQNGANWHEIIDKLHKPKATKLLFERGLYYLHHISIGYVIIGMSNDLQLNTVTSACIKVEKKLSDPVLCKKVLLKMLSTSNDQLKPHILKELVPFADVEVAQPLIALLEKQEDFASGSRDRLLRYICQTLGYCACRDAIKPLKRILEISKEDKSVAWSNILSAIDLSLTQLESAPPSVPSVPRSAPQPTSRSAPPVTRPTPPVTRPTSQSVTQKKATVATVVPKQKQTTPTSTGVVSAAAPKSKQSNLPQAKQIETFLDKGEKAAAIALIMQMIEKSVSQYLFLEAEQFREWLMQIDSMAITEIIRSAEMIEEGKNASIDDETFSTWGELVDCLTPDEFSSLYHVMTQVSYKSGEMIASQGEMSSTLFFINSGHVQLYAVIQDTEVPLKELSPGEIIGTETFFEVSVWTINAKSLGAEISQLSHKNLQALKDTHPALESKLLDFSSRFLSMNTLFSKNSRTRRQSERKQLSVQTYIILLNKEGNEIGSRAKGDLLDISKGGASFALRFSLKNKAIALLGQKLRIAIPTNNPALPFLLDGTVVAVKCQDFIGNEYSIHIEFDKQLASEKIQQSIAQNR